MHYVITHYTGDKLELMRSLLKHGADVNMSTAVSYNWKGKMGIRFSKEIVVACFGFFVLQEGDTALNLSIKRGELRAQNVMYQLAELLFKNESDTRARDLVHEMLITMY